jgi:rpsU-divergently transcribed protein
MCHPNSIHSTQVYFFQKLTVYIMFRKGSSFHIWIRWDGMSLPRRSIHTTTVARELKQRIPCLSYFHLNSPTVVFRHVLCNKRYRSDPANQYDWDEKRKTILSAALPFVQQYGWTDQAIAEGVLSCGYPPSMIGLVPLSTSSSCHPLIEYYMNEANQKLRLQLLDSTTKDRLVFPSKQERLMYAIRTRLLMNEPYLKSKRWTEGMALGVIYPSNALVTSLQLEEMLDIIYKFSLLEEGKPSDGAGSSEAGWNKINDSSSIDPNPSSTIHKDSSPLNRVVDRSSIAFLYIVTELFMLTDQSDGYKDTWEFLAARLNEVHSMQGTIPSPFSILSQIQTESILRPEVATAAAAVVSSMGGAMLSLLTPMAKMGVGSIADVLIPQILSSMRHMNTGASSNSHSHGSMNNKHNHST